MLVFYPAGKVMDRKGRRWVAVPSMLMMGVPCSCMPLDARRHPLLLAAVLIGFGNGIGSGMVMTLGADYSPAAGRAHFLGLWRLVSDIGSTGGPALLSPSPRPVAGGGHLVHRPGRLRGGRRALVLDPAHRSSRRYAERQRGLHTGVSRSAAVASQPRPRSAPGRGIRRIEPGQRDAVLDLAHDPALEPLLLERRRDDLLDQRRRESRTAPSSSATITSFGKHRDAAAADRLLPADERQSRDRGRRGGAGHQTGSPVAEHAGEVAHDAVGDQRRRRRASSCARRGCRRRCRRR